MSDVNSIVRFVPSHVEGLPDVEEVTVSPHQLEVKTAAQWVIFRFDKIGRAQEPTAKSFLKRIVGMPVVPPMVGERNWFQVPKDRFFLWYTDPLLKTCMPETEGADYATSLFPRIHGVLAAGGFSTFDLG